MGFAFSSSWDKNWLVKLRAGFSRVKLEVFSSRTFQNIVSPNITRNIIGLGGIICNKICHLLSVQTGTWIVMVKLRAWDFSRVKLEVFFPRSFQNMTACVTRNYTEQYSRTWRNFTKYRISLLLFSPELVGEILNRLMLQE